MVKLRALQYERDEDGLPSAYFGYAEQDVTLSARGPMMVDLALEPLADDNATRTIEVTADVEGEDAAPSTGLLLLGSPTNYTRLGETTSAQANVSLLVPVDPRVELAVLASSSEGEGYGSIRSEVLTASTAAVELTVPATVSPIAPAADATGVTQSTEIVMPWIDDALYFCTFDTGSDRVGLYIEQPSFLRAF